MDARLESLVLPAASSAWLPRDKHNHGDQLYRNDDNSHDYCHDYCYEDKQQLDVDLDEHSHGLAEFVRFDL